MKIINGIPAKMAADVKTGDNSLVNVQKRLELLYPGRHELRISTDQELLMVYLNLNLEETAEEQPTVVEINKPALNHA